MSETKLSLLDKAIYQISPATALKRAHARQVFEFSYDAANPGRARKTANPFGNRSAESSLVNRDRIKMMWEARDLAKNFSFVKSVLMKEAMYVCGKIQFQAQTGDSDIDKVYEDYWNDWSQRADITGRHVFRQMIQLQHIGMRCDGESGVILRPEGPEIKLQAIEGDRIGNPNEGSQNSDYYFNGIRVSPDTGAIEDFTIYQRTRMGMYKNPETVNPSNFIHYFDPLRSDQYHGITAFDTTIPHARDMYELMQMEKMAVKWGSSHAGVITKDNKEYDNWGDNKTDNGTNLEKIEPGTVLRTLPGEDVAMFRTSSRPSPTFNGFIETLVREMANGLNLPYSFVWDMASLGGVSARIELAMTQRAFKRAQNLLVEQVLNKVRDAVLSRAISYKLIPPHENWRKSSWQFPSHITADQGYSVASDIQLLNTGLKTASGIIGEMGEDYEATVEKLAKEIEIQYKVAQKTGIPMELISQRFPNPTQMLMSQGQPMEPQV